MTQRSMERCFILLCAKSSIREKKWNYRELVACLSGVFGEVASSRAQFNNMFAVHLKVGNMAVNSFGWRLGLVIDH